MLEDLWGPYLGLGEGIVEGVIKYGRDLALFCGTVTVALIFG